jgi:AcrR family transcriptional regulator
LSEPSSGPTLGLRERKKARTRAAIQTHALRLFRDQGYDATTVQQIIEEAEVSESTFFRYFPTKSDVVLTDDFDPLIVEAFLGQPPQVRPVPALRAAFAAVFERLSDQEVSDQQQRMQLVLAVPELRASMLDQLASAMHLLSAVLAERTGRQPEDLAVLTVAGAVVGAVIAVTFAMGEVSTANFAARLDEAMGHLETGLEL